MVGEDEPLAFGQVFAVIPRGRSGRRRWGVEAWRDVYGAMETTKNAGRWRWAARCVSRHLPLRSLSRWHEHALRPIDSFWMLLLSFPNTAAHFIWIVIAFGGELAADFAEPFESVVALGLW